METRRERKVKDYFRGGEVQKYTGKEIYKSRDILRHAVWRRTNDFMPFQSPFFILFIYLFIFIEGEGREKERERNIAVREKP